MGVPMKMMLSLSSREKMSYARSPRLVCSTTIGTSCIRESLLLPGNCWRIVKMLFVAGNRAEQGSWLGHCKCSTRHEEVNRLFPAQPRRHTRHPAFLFERSAHRRGRAARALRPAADFLLDLVRG